MNSRHSGFTLIEMIVLTTLAGVFMLLASQAFMQTKRVMVQTQVSGQQASRWDGVVRHLRRDAWRCSAIDQDASRGDIVLSQPDGRAITWTWPDNDQPIRRVEKMGDQLVAENTWQALPGNRLEVAGAGLVLRVAQAHQAEQEVRMVSQHLLLEGEQ